MTIKIGDKSLTTRRPDDLDAQLRADTGHDAAEIGRALSGEPLAGTVARALLPFLAADGRPSAPELAAEIAAAGTAGVARQVAALYAASGADELDGLTVPKLRELAAAETLDLGGATTRPDIIAAIRAAREAKRAGSGEAE